MKKLSTLLVATLTISGAILATNVLAYQSNTGAGSTNQYGGFANQYRIQQSYQRPPAPSYYQAMPQRAPTTPQSKFMPHPSGIPGYPPVLVEMSPQANKQIGDFAVKKVPQCVKGSIAGAGVGFYRGGPSGAAGGAVGGCITNVITN